MGDPGSNCRIVLSGSIGGISPYKKYFSRSGNRQGEQYAENAYFRLRPVAHVATLATIALCAAAYWVGFLSGPFGVRGLVLFTTILVTGWVIGMATGFFGALASRGG